MIERIWGAKRFIFFYLACGAMGGIVYPLLVVTGVLDIGYLIGASGAIYGILVACAILFPHIRVLLYFAIAVPIRIAVVGFVIFSVANFAVGKNAGGETAHLAGMALGAVYTFVSESFRNRPNKINDNPYRNIV